MFFTVFFKRAPGGGRARGGAELPRLADGIFAPAHNNTQRPNLRMEQEKINANVNQLSQKLLEGCKLLSESCPETNVPLVSTMDGRMYSVGNGCYDAREGSELVKVAAESVAPPPPATPGSPNRPSLMAYASGAPPGSVEMPTVPPIETQSLSSRVAAKLLEGFTLLSESCPVTSVPLVQDPSGRILSVGTGKWYERTGGELLESSAGPPLDATLPPATMPAIAAITALPPPQKTSPPPSSLADLHTRCRPPSKDTAAASAAGHLPHTPHVPQPPSTSPTPSARVRLGRVRRGRERGPTGQRGERPPALRREWREHQDGCLGGGCCPLWKTDRGDGRAGGGADTGGGRICRDDQGHCARDRRAQGAVGGGGRRRTESGEGCMRRESMRARRGRRNRERAGQQMSKSRECIVAGGGIGGRR